MNGSCEWQFTGTPIIAFHADSSGFEPDIMLERGETEHDWILTRIAPGATLTISDGVTFTAEDLP